MSGREVFRTKQSVRFFAVDRRGEVKLHLYRQHHCAADEYYITGAERQLHVAVVIGVFGIAAEVMKDNKFTDRNTAVQGAVFAEMFNQNRQSQHLLQGRLGQQKQRKKKDSDGFFHATKLCKMKEVLYD